MKPRIYITRMIPPRSLSLLEEHCEIAIWQETTPPPPDVLLAEMQQSVGVIPMVSEKIDAAVLDAASSVRIISNFAVGYDNIDIPAATARGIPVGHTPDVLTESCADHAFGMMLAAARRFSEAQQYIRQGKWQGWYPLQLLGYDVHGATLGIVGPGRIGRAIARRSTGFGMRLLYHGGSDADPLPGLNAEAVSLDDLLQQSDFVSVSVPLNDDTYHLISGRELALMKPSAVLVNTSRGGVVDPDALYDALQAGQIFAAGLDVTEPEPLPPDHRLLTLPNCLILPHIASATLATRENIGRLAAENMLAALRGEPMPHCVNPEVYAQD